MTIGPAEKSYPVSRGRKHSDSESVRSPRYRRRSRLFAVQSWCGPGRRRYDRLNVSSCAVTRARAALAGTRVPASTSGSRSAPTLTALRVRVSRTHRRGPLPVRPTTPRARRSRYSGGRCFEPFRGPSAEPESLRPPNFRGHASLLGNPSRGRSESPFI